LAEHIVRSDDTIVAIYYFTTFVNWKPDSVRRHKEYIKALRSENIKDVRGRFLKKRVRCHVCGKSYKTREEKQTDVNIALRMLYDAVEDNYDRAIIVSGDTDLVPVIETIHALMPDKEVGVVFPLRRYNNSLEKAADFAKTMTEKMLSRCQFPDELKIGNTIIKRPDSWY